jgi:hypothetical protein
LNERIEITHFPQGLDIARFPAKPLLGN